MYTHGYVMVLNLANKTTIVKYNLDKERMMKLRIAVDMEGTSGITTWDQVTPGHAEWQRFRRIMTADVNAAISGAFAGGADEVVVSDGHWNGDNLLFEELDKRASLNTGSPSPWSMVQGVNEGVDAAFFVGYHARNGTANAILDHTWSAARVHHLFINGRVSAEVGLNGSLCGHFGVPVLMVSGDHTVGAEAREWIAGVETVTTKIAQKRNRVLMRFPGLRGDHDLAFGQAIDDLQAIIAGDTYFHIDAALTVAILHDHKLAAFKVAHSLRRQPEHVFFLLQNHHRAHQVAKR
jgi:hypothetical protein